jgi:hypothetical protein
VTEWHACYSQRWMEDPSSMDQGSRLMGQTIEIGGVQPSCCLVDVELHMQIAGGLVGACWARSITISGFRDRGRTECSSVLGLRNLARRLCQLQFQMSAFQALRRLRAIQSFLIRPSTAAATSVPNPTSKHPRSNQGSPRAFRSCRCAGADLSFSPQQRITPAV